MASMLYGFHIEAILCSIYSLSGALLYAWIEEAQSDIYDLCNICIK